MSSNIYSAQPSTCPYRGAHQQAAAVCIPMAPIVAACSVGATCACSRKTSSTVTSSTQTYTRVTASNETLTIYPPKADASVAARRYTYASFNEEPVSALDGNTTGTWSLAVKVPIPTDILNPTLVGLTYAAKYATTFDRGDSTIQTDAIITSKTVTEGIATDGSDLGVYVNKAGYESRVLNQNEAYSLSSSLSIKSNSQDSQWSHYVDNYHINSNVRIVSQSSLYVIFHVAEYPSATTIRSLSIVVSATWDEDLEARKAKEEAERKAREEAERKAKEEAARIAKEEANRKAKEEADRKAKEEADRKAKEEAAKQSVAQAPAVADEKLQNQIADKMKELKIEPCPNGYAFKKTDYGYVCNGGGHKITFEQLGMK